MPIFSLKNQKEFDFVKKCGSKKHSSYFIVILSKNTSLLRCSSDKATFLGLKVSRKYSKKAVIRNRAKRRIRHLVNILIQDPSIDINKKALIVIPKVGLNKAKFSDIEQDFKKSIVHIMHN